MTKRNNDLIIYIFIVFYFTTNLFFLELFPFVHSDESWLSGLTRNMMETGTISCTETFFDLFPRAPHTFKTVFHMLQMPSIIVFGYDIFSIRLISLIFASLSLYLFYKIITKLISNSTSIFPLLITIVMAFDIQFIYSSHFARQEIILVFISLLCFLIYITKPRFINKNILLGTIIGLSIGIHPNSFIVALIFGFLYLYDNYIKQRNLKDLLVLIVTVMGFVAIFGSMSLFMSNNFIVNYISYGETLGVTSTIGDKILGLWSYYYKLFFQISGTYYVAPIRFQLILFVILIGLGITYSFIKKERNIIRLLLIIFSIHLGLIVIGRYNATYVIFTFPFFYLLLGLLLDKFFYNKRRWSTFILLYLILMYSYKDYQEIQPLINKPYDAYLEQISTYLSQDDKVLGNLNCEFYFDNGKLLDFRNLAYLEENNMSFSDYIKTNNIEYVVLPEEMDYIYRNSQWQILYGEMNYYEDMKKFIADNCELIGEFSNPQYGIRIVKYMNTYDWKVRIYRVNY